MHHLLVTSSLIFFKYENGHDMALIMLPIITCSKKTCCKQVMMTSLSLERRNIDDDKQRTDNEARAFVDDDTLTPVTFISK